jgi:hypothetical protein
MILVIGSGIALMTTGCSRTCTVDHPTLEGAQLWLELSGDTESVIIRNGTNCEYIEKEIHYGITFYKLTCDSNTGYISENALVCQ